MAQCCWAFLYDMVKKIQQPRNSELLELFVNCRLTASLLCCNLLFLLPRQQANHHNGDAR